MYTVWIVHMIRNIMAGGIFLSIGFLLVKLLSFFYIPILSRFLGPEGMGTLNLAVLITPWVISFSSFSLSFVVTQFIAEHRNRYSGNTIVGTSLAVGLFLGGLATIGYFFLAPWIAEHSFHDPSLTTYLQLASPIIVFSVLYTVVQGAIRGFKDFKRFALYEFFKQLMNVGIGLLFLFIGYRVGGAIVAMVISTAFMVLFFVLKYLRGKLSFSFSLVKEMIAFGGGITALSFMLTMLSGLDRYFLGTTVEKATIGFYAVAASVISASTFFPNSMRSSTFPYIAEYYTKGKIGLAKRSLEQSMKYLLIVVGIFSLGMMTFRYELVQILFGSSFLPAVPIFTMLLYSLPFQSIYLLFHVLAIATGQLRLALALVLVTVTTALTLYKITVPSYGVAGAAGTFIFTYILISLSYGYLLWKKIPISFWQSSIVLSLQLALMTVAAFITGSLLTHIVVGAATGLAYAGTLLILRIVTVYEITRSWEILREKARGFYLWRRAH